MQVDDIRKAIQSLEGKIRTLTSEPKVIMLMVWLFDYWDLFMQLSQYTCTYIVCIYMYVLQLRLEPMVSR